MNALLALLLLPGCGDGPGGPQPPDPDGMVRLSHADGRVFWIDRYEFPDQEGVKPVTYVDLDTSIARCEEVGKRLCTAEEWRRACLGPQGVNRYGYGPTYEPDRCHSARRLPSGHTSMMDPDELVAPSGAFERCATPEGVHDLVGNLEEWVLDDWHGLPGMLEGGAWYTHIRYADCTGAYSRQADYRVDPHRKVFSAGFRCCWSESPPTPEDIARDSVRRLEEARERSSDAPYDPEPEVEIAPGTFIDLFEYPNRPGEVPRVVVTWEEADALCREAGKRLCSAYEWEWACGGPEGWPYPYGRRFMRAACAVELDGPVPSGTYLACVSPSGARDMVGSVWEWTATELAVPGLRHKETDVLRELRGGSWYVDPEKGQCVPVQGYPASPQDAAFPDVGFRCCRGPELGMELVAEPGTLTCPEGMVAIADFCIDRFEFPNRQGERPRANLDLEGAIAACASVGKHVCTDREWERACAGSAGRRWPYGNVYRPDVCKDESRARQTQAGEAAPSGSYPGCTTPEGVMDLSGNLWEWVVRTGRGPRGEMRGGAWNISSGLGTCKSVAHGAPTYRSAETGTRCCASAAEARALLEANGD